MPTESRDSNVSHRILHGCEFPLWSGIPEGWLRNQGRTRVLVIDDQLARRQDLFAVASETAPLSDEEADLRKWMNVEIQFLARPQDYRYGIEDKVPRGTFDTAWLGRALGEALQDPCPIAAVLLDLLYGSEQRIENASGPKFLALLRQQLPETPVLVLSNVDETPEVCGIVKEGRGTGKGDASFQDYLPKRLDGGPGLLERLREKLVEWGDLSDPGLCAFSPGMRRLAREMRRIVMFPELTDYQEPNGKFPKPILIKGAVGSGKNYVANLLHAMSERRNTPYLTVTFSTHETHDFTSTLFGVGMYDNAPQWYRVRRTDGALLEVMPARARVPAGDSQYLGSLGVLHRAHIADQAPGLNQVPLRGSLLIDEIGAAPQEMQTRLLQVFNRGRFTPHLTSVEIPAEGAIDVWFLITLSPEGQEKLREDLRTRLGDGWWLDVPSLRERKEDILPLALQKLGVSADEVPERFFTREALKELPGLSETMQVREFRAVIAGLSTITKKPPYSADELRQSAAALRLGGLSEAPDTSSSISTIGKIKNECAVAETQKGDVMEVLLRCDESRRALFSPMLSDRDRGKGRKLRAGAAVALLSFLELCVQAKAEAGRYSTTRTWNFFAGVQSTKAPDARTFIASLFLVDEEVSLDMLRRSDALLWLALDVSKRRREVSGLVERLRAEDAQAVRFEKVQSGEESEQ